jgi:hypothetical protein
MVLDCYRLARWYHVSPEIFLIMPVSEVMLHLHRTAQLDRQQQSVTGED